MGLPLPNDLHYLGFMPIYTRHGDTGETGLLEGHRVSKDDPRIDALGTLDELNAVIGVVRAIGTEAALDSFLHQVQRDLLTLGAELSAPPGQSVRPGFEPITASDVTRLEARIDGFVAMVPPLTAFILPGGHPTSAALHHARTVCRRAERLVFALQRREPLPANVGAYLNRLGDALFVAARYANHAVGVPDRFWQDAGPR